MARVKVGQKVIRTPKTIGVMPEGKSFAYTLENRPMKGVVVSVPKHRRFHVVEFENGLRETFDGVE